MSNILAKPVKTLIPPRQLGESPMSIPEPTQTTRSLPPAPPPESNSASQERLPRQVVAWPFPGTAEASEARQNVPEVPPALIPIVKPGAPPVLTPITPPAPHALTPIVKPAAVAEPVVEQTAPAVAVPPDMAPAAVVAAPIELDTNGNPKLIPIGDASLQPTVGVPLAEGFTPPALAVTRRGSQAVVEIPSLAIKPRDVHCYIILGILPDEGGQRIYGTYLPDVLNRLPGETLPQKLVALCQEKYNAMSSESEFGARRDAGYITTEVVTPDNSSSGVVVKLVLIDNDQGRHHHNDSERHIPQPYVCFEFKVIKFKMNDLGTTVALDMLP